MRGTGPLSYGTVKPRIHRGQVAESYLSRPVVGTHMRDAERTGQLGLAGMLGGLLLAVYGIPDVLDPATFSGSSATATVYGLLLVVPMVGVLAGVVGLRRYHEDTFGRLGRWSAAAVAVGLVLVVLALLWGYGVTGGTFALFGVPDAVFVVMVLSLLVLVLGGSIPLGYATYRAGRLPPAAPLALLASVPLGFAAFAVLLSVFESGGPFVGLLFPYGVAWTLLGHRLWRGAESPGRTETAGRVDQSEERTDPTEEGTDPNEKGTDPSEGRMD